MAENEKTVDKQKVDALLANFDGEVLVHQAAVSLENTIANLEKAVAQFTVILSNAMPISEDQKDRDPIFDSTL